MTTNRVKPSHRRWWLLTLVTSMVSGAAACTDTLGLDDFSVNTSAAATSTGAGASGGGGVACMDCAIASCVDVLTTCYMDSAPAGCQAFLTCAEACGDEACAAGCLADNPAGQTAVDCFCAECAAACTLYCGAEGGAGGTSAGGGGIGGTGPAGGTGGVGGAGG